MADMGSILRGKITQQGVDKDTLDQSDVKTRAYEKAQAGIVQPTAVSKDDILRALSKIAAKALTPVDGNTPALFEGKELLAAFIPIVKENAQVQTSVASAGTEKASAPLLNQYHNQVDRAAAESKVESTQTPSSEPPALR